MNRRVFLSTMTGGLLAAPLAAEAQPAPEVHRIGYLLSGSGASSHLVEGFRQGLVSSGGLRARTSSSSIDLRRVDSTGCPTLAAELVRLNVDILVAGATPPAVAAKNATGTIPIVMVGVGNPVGVGLIVRLGDAVGIRGAAMSACAGDDVCRTRKPMDLSHPDINRWDRFNALAQQGLVHLGFQMGDEVVLVLEKGRAEGG